MDTRIRNLRNLFLQKISLNKNVDDEILQLLDAILYELNGSSIDLLRQKSANLSHELHELGSNAVPYLLSLLLRKLEAVSFKPTIKAKEVESDIDEEFFIDYFKKCFESCSDNGIRILTFEIPPLDECKEKGIYCSTKNLLNTYIEVPININELNAEIPPRAICLGISKEPLNKSRGLLR